MTRRELRATLERWRGYAPVLAAPAVELTAEEFAPVMSTFLALCAAGHRFDPTLSAVMGQLARQMIRGETDADLEEDDPTAGKGSDDDVDTDVSIDTSLDCGSMDWQKHHVVILIRPDGEQERSKPRDSSSAA